MQQNVQKKPAEIKDIVNDFISDMQYLPNNYASTIQLRNHRWIQDTPLPEKQLENRDQLRLKLREKLMSNLQVRLQNPFETWKLAEECNSKEHFLKDYYKNKKKIQQKPERNGGLTTQFKNEEQDGKRKFIQRRSVGERATTSQNSQNLTRAQVSQIVFSIDPEREEKLRIQKMVTENIKLYMKKKGLPYNDDKSRSNSNHQSRATFHLSQNSPQSQLPVLTYQKQPSPQPQRQEKSKLKRRKQIEPNILDSDLLHNKTLYSQNNRQVIQNCFSAIDQIKSFSTEVARKGIKIRKDYRKLTSTMEILDKEVLIENKRLIT